MKAKDTNIKSFKMALLNRPINPNQSLIYHSDRGIQYVCEEIYLCELNKHKSIFRSISRKGDCWDNAVAESFFKTLKVELIYQIVIKLDNKLNYQFSNISKHFIIQIEDINN